MKPNGIPSMDPSRRSRWLQSAPNVFGRTPSMSCSARALEMARSRAFSEYSELYCVPDRGPDWPTLPVSADSPSSDCLQPCGRPKQRFRDQLKARSSARAGGVILGNQFSVPPQQSSWCGDRRYLIQRLTPKLFRFGRQSPTLIIGEPQTLVTDLFSKDSILLH